MRTALYILAVLLIVGWVIGLAMKVAGGLIHILLVVAVISILINILQSKRA